MRIIRSSSEPLQGCSCCCCRRAASRPREPEEAAQDSCCHDHSSTLRASGGSRRCCRVRRQRGPGFWLRADGEATPRGCRGAVAAHPDVSTRGRRQAGCRSRRPSQRAGQCQERQAQLSVRSKSGAAPRGPLREPTMRRWQRHQWRQRPCSSGHGPLGRGPLQFDATLSWCCFNRNATPSASSRHVTRGQAPGPYAAAGEGECGALGAGGGAPSTPFATLLRVAALSRTGSVAPPALASELAAARVSTASLWSPAVLASPNSGTRPTRERV